MDQLNLMKQKFQNYQFQLLQNLGLLRTFQQTRIYGKLNCIENMLISHKPSNDENFDCISKNTKRFNR